MTEVTQIFGKQKILLLDDDPDVLQIYQQMLLQLPSKPEVHIATSGARAMELLDAEDFDLLISDLKMPKMDGLQVITIVRRTHPQLKTIVLTGVADEDMRSRAYAMGVDLYLEKPGNSKELTLLMQCIEGLLTNPKAHGGFRGLQSKSLVDLIQLECLSGSSSVLKITNGKIEGRIWIKNGDLIDASTPDEEGEAAFKRILSWRSGNFEILPMQTDRPRRITVSYQGLLLDSVQAHDEAQADKPEEFAASEAHSEGKDVASGDGSDTQFLHKSGLGRIKGVEFALKIPQDPNAPVQKWGVENPESMVAWIRGAVSEFESLGLKLDFGALKEFEGRGTRQQLSVVLQKENTIAIGMLPNLTREQVEQNTQKVLERWAS